MCNFAPMNRTVATLIHLLAFLAFFGCERHHDPHTLTLSLAADIRGFDPALATDIRSGQAMSLVYDNLVRFGAETDLLPGIARAWEVNAQGIVYTFHLRRNIFFQDGSPLSARDVVFSLERVLDPATRSPQTWLFDRIIGAKAFMNGKTDDVEGLRAPNDSTVVISISVPFAPFIQYLAMPSAAIVNQKLVQHINEHPAGSGPWELKSWERDGELVFIRNEAYWGRKAKIEKLRFRILSENMARSAEFEAGNLDLLEIPEVDLPRWQNDPNVQNHLLVQDGLDIYYIGMNCSRPPFNDLRLRQAMNLALDREKILKILLNGAATLASGPVPPSLRGDELKPYPYDPEEARRLIINAGYGDGLAVQLWVAGGTEMYQVLEAMQSDWAAVGIQVDLLRSDWNVFKTAVREGKPDLYYLNWRADYPDAENFLYPLFYSTESMTKRNRYTSAQADSLIHLVQTLPAGERRQSLIVETNRFIFAAAPWVFLWHKRVYVMTQPWIENYQPKLIFNAERYLDVRKGQFPL